MPTVTFTVQAKSNSPTQTVVQADKHEIILDEPKTFGGQDKGANPVQHILAALAGCLNVIGHMVAKEMGIEIRSLEMTARGSLDPTRIHGRPSDQRTGFKSIEIDMQIESDADAATLDKWIAAVESRCPVSDNLSVATPINVKIQS